MLKPKKRKAILKAMSQGVATGSSEYMGKKPVPIKKLKKVTRPMTKEEFKKQYKKLKEKQRKSKMN